MAFMPKSLRGYGGAGDHPSPKYAPAPKLFLLPSLYTLVVFGGIGITIIWATGWLGEGWPYNCKAGRPQPREAIPVWGLSLYLSFHCAVRFGFVAHSVAVAECVPALPLWLK